jgi:hypothetical protein
MSHEVLSDLFRAKVLVPHPKSSIDAFIWEGLHQSSFYTLRVSWGLPIGGSSLDLQSLINRIETSFRNQKWLEIWKEQWLDLWKKVALWECLEYLNLVMKEHHFDFTPGEKTMTVLAELLEMYSVGQVWRIIWISTTNAVAYKERSGIPKSQAANSVVGGMQRYGERARSEGWRLDPFKRDRRIPQSMISQVLFNAVLQLGESYLGVTADESIASAVVP